MRPADDIRDPDLLAKLERARGSLVFDAMRTICAKEQKERDEVAARRTLMTRDQVRRDEIREIIENDPTGPENLQHIHSVLALCGLPYKRPAAEDGQHFVRRYGKNSLALTAGMLTNPATGDMEPQGLPYGPKARLLLLHLCSEAIRQKSPTIEIADSLTSFIRDLGFPVTGGARGSLKQFKEQLNRIAACHMQIGMWDPEKGARTINAAPVESFDVWLPQHPDQKVLWSSTLTFEDRFYKSLVNHALPVDMRAARAFAGSARKLDMLFWLGYRLRSITRPYLLTWQNLHTQFGQGTTNLRSFRQEFRSDLNSIKDVFPKLP